MAASLESEIYNEVRKLRKKLRQIENLQRLDRELTEEEEVKVSKKLPIRLQLQDLLSQIPEEDIPLHSRAASSSAVNSATYSTAESSVSWSTADSSTISSPDTVTAISPASARTDTESGKGVGGGAEVKEDEERENEKVTTDMKPSEINDRDNMKRKSDSQNIPNETISESQRAQTVPKKKSKKAAHKEHDEKVFKLQKAWRQSEFVVSCLEGHNDLVISVALEKDWLLSGSRDTTMKLWEGSTGRELYSFGGHTDSVTAVLFIPKEDCADLAGQYELAEDDRLLVSGSMDCAVRLWSLKTGCMVKSIYTYNPVTCMTYCTPGRLLVTGSSGGKVELWSLATGENICSLVAFDEATTCLRMDDDKIYSASADGFIKIFTIKDGKLSLLFESEDVKGVNGEDLLLRHIRSLSTSKDTIYYGDDGSNLKVLSWKQGIVHKLKNHVCEFGSTDAVAVLEDQVLLTAGFDLDNGCGYFNVRSLPEEQYLSTVSSADTGRMMCLQCTRLPHGAVRVATGGTELKIWEQVKTGMKISSPLPVNGAIVTSHYNPKYTSSPQNSDIDSDTETDDEGSTGLWARFTGSSGRAGTRGQPHRESDTEEDLDQPRRWCRLL
ncbi:pre-mRNA-splicing factor PRP46 [Lingula anatina]|uniref:Pre-mRNA-splicing factor PRP46 n=1 Tax=Lingula anatina TaxID=7574 RepID=A0A1S3JLC0_LINAN|nr:pre-mRNA-splicing factor PRP46 [Lingula anatina]|eukprot:XP_013410936.1 pre-mRNA-splicing factor PRP46 [Lingula anatina]